MNFVSLEYILFFVAVFTVYWLPWSRRKVMQNTIIVVASILFYGMIDWKLLSLMFATVFSSFWAGYLIDREKRRKMALAGALVFNFGILFLLKYYNFFIGAVTDLFELVGMEISAPMLRLLVPVGISFYTFTALSYVIDIYNRKVERTKDFMGYMAYVIFFPSLLCGPIGRSTMQLPQFLNVRSFDYSKAITGCRLILIGVALKVCIADNAGSIVNLYYDDIVNQDDFADHGCVIFFSDICGFLRLLSDGCRMWKVVGIRTAEEL